MSPRPPVASRESLLEVAVRLFRENGIRATAVADVITAAGCGKQAFYRVFANKDDLVAAYLTDRVAAREASTAAALRSAGEEPAGRLVALITEVAAWTGQPGYRGCAVRNYLREYPETDSPATEVATAYLRASYQRVQRLSRATHPDDAQALATKAWLIHEGLFASTTTARTAEAARALITSLVTGARPRPGGSQG